MRQQVVHTVAEKLTLKASTSCSELLLTWHCTISTPLDARALAWALSVLRDSPRTRHLPLRRSASTTLPP